MAPSHSRHLLVLATLPIALILSYLWFKRKRSEVRTDVGTIEEKGDIKEVTLDQELIEAENSSAKSSTLKRSLSGVESTPIDIIYPRELKSTKSTQVVITDEDLDFEIEKIKSMKSPLEFYSKKNSNCLTASPKEEQPMSDPRESVQEAQLEVKEEPARDLIDGVIELAIQQEGSQLDQAPGLVEVVQDQEQKVPEDEKIVLEEQKVTVPEEDIKVEMDTEIKRTEELKNIDNANKKALPKNKKKKKTKFHKLIQQAPPVERKPVSNHKSQQNQQPGTEEELLGRARERDSANHSPVEVMVASSSMSSICSIAGSTDSGKGRSEVASPPSRHSSGDCDTVDQPIEAIFHFDVPERCCGKLIGLQGANISKIKEKSITDILLKKYPPNCDKSGLNVCVVKGSQEGITRALGLIRKRFPIKFYPDLTLDPVSFGPPPVPIIPLEESYMKLVDGIHNDTIVSCMVAPNHLFLHLHTHPTYPHLSVLNRFMNNLYNCDANSPSLPSPVPVHSLCASPSQGAWYRAVVLTSQPEDDSCTIQFLDYGGYATLCTSDLRQIHQDCARLPFQAVECVLYNVQPVGSDGIWSQKAYELVEELTKNIITTTHVIDYTTDEIPLVNIYAIASHRRAISINAELVKRGYAEWIELQDVPCEEVVEAVVA